MFEAKFWKSLRNSEAQPKFTLSYKKINVYHIYREKVTTEKKTGKKRK